MRIEGGLGKKKRGGGGGGGGGSKDLGPGTCAFFLESSATIPSKSARKGCRRPERTEGY